MIITFIIFFSLLFIMTLFSKLNDYLKVLEETSFTKPIPEKVKIKPSREVGKEIVKPIPKKRMFRFKGDSSDKFWEVWVEKKELKVRFGKYRTEGRVIIKGFSSNAEAVREMEKRIKEKIKKGYGYEGLKSEDDEIPFRHMVYGELKKEDVKIVEEKREKFNPVLWEHNFEGGEIVEAYYNGSGFIGKVVRVSGQRATNPKSVRVEPIGIYEDMFKAIYPKTPYTIPKIEASKWSPFRESLVPLKQEELIMYNDGEDLMAIWKVRKNKGIETIAHIWREYGKELNVIKKIKPFLEFLYNEFPFPKSEDDYELMGNFLKFFGKDSDNNFQNDDILDTKAILLEFVSIDHNIFKGGIIYAKLVRFSEEVGEIYEEYSDMVEPAYLNDPFLMLLWDFEKQLPFKIYHIKSKIVIEEWSKKEKQEELREDVKESLEEFVEEHKTEFEERVKEIKKISWDLSDTKFKSSLERKMVITDMNFVMKELKLLIENEEDLISYGYDEKKKIYYLEYDSTDYNEFLIKLISHLIDQIIQRKVTLKTIKPNIDEIKERMEAYKQVAKKKAKMVKKKKVKKEIVEEKGEEYEIIFEELEVKNLEQELEDNLLGIVCDVLTNSDFDKVFQKYLYGRLYGLGYKDSDFAYIYKKINELQKKNVIKKGYTYQQNFPYYVLGSNKKLCEERDFEINPVDLEIPLLYEYPNISSSDIGKRAIIQILCHNSKQSNKNRGSYIDTLSSRWLRFFQYTYKPKDKPEDYHYLKDDLKLSTFINMEKKFRSDLSDLLKDTILVSTSPPPKYTELIRLQKDYGFIWKTYKFGVFSEVQEISENTLYINKERINELKNLKEYQNINDLLDKKKDYFTIAVHKNYPIYLIYDRTEFNLIEFEDHKKGSSFNSISLSMDRKIIQTEIIQYFQFGKGFHKIEKTNYRKWKSLRTGKLITLAVSMKF